MLRGVRQRQVESPFLHEIGQAAVRRTDKTTPDRPPRRPRESLQEFNRRDHADSDPFYEDADERELIEALEASELIPEQFAGIRPGRRVWSKKFGTGQVMSISADGTRTRAVIEFDRSGRKALILEHAHLEPM